MLAQRCVGGQHFTTVGALWPSSLHSTFRRGRSLSGEMANGQPRNKPARPFPAEILSMLTKVRNEADVPMAPSAAHAVAADPSQGRIRARLVVHLGLLASAAGSLVTLEFLHIRIAIHTVVGLAFIGFVALHLVQRRRTLWHWARQLLRSRPRSSRRSPRLVSDLILAVIALNVLASGYVDWNRGRPTEISLPPPFTPFGRWHALSSIVLVVYLLMHVTRRRSRLRRSVIQ